jgi:hypothetical protein
MILFLSRPGESSPTKTAVWRDFQAWGIIAQVRSNVRLQAVASVTLLPTTMPVVVADFPRA